ncbi:MAG: hypothetical protein ACYTEQ_21875 [Planctomycetota bacterium]|jgi:hypothetical protein
MAFGKKTHLGVIDVFGCVLRIAPFVWRNQPVPWHTMRVPGFPIAFSLLSGLIWAVTSQVKAMQVVQHPVSLQQFVFPFIGSLIVSGAFFVALNGIIMGAFWVVLTQFKSKSGESGSGTSLAGAQRVSYFSTFFQPIFFLILALPFLIQRRVGFVTWVEYTLLVSLAGSGLIRLVAAFQSMRRETGGSILAGLLASLLCFDLWGTFLPIAWGYIW